MEDVAKLFVLFLTLLCVWSAFGCIVRAVRLRYTPLLWLAAFFGFFGTLLGSLIGPFDLPTWSNFIVFLPFGLYRWRSERHPPAVPLRASHILAWRK